MFVEDSKAGDLICKVCGSILSQRRTVDGDWTRGAFADEGDQSQQGPAMQLHHSPQWNLRTSFGEAPGVSKAAMSKLHRTWASIERGQEAGAVRTGGRTTIAYKDKMKSRAFSIMEETGARLRLHRAVVEAAKALFSGFRDDREQLIALDIVIVACLAVACARSGITEFNEIGETHKDASLGVAASEKEEAAEEAQCGMAAYLPEADAALSPAAREAAKRATAAHQRAVSRRRRLSAKPRFLTVKGHRAMSIPDSTLLVSKQTVDAEHSDAPSAAPVKRERADSPTEELSSEYGGNHDVLALLDTIAPDPHAAPSRPVFAVAARPRKPPAPGVAAAAGPSRAQNVLSRLRALQARKKRAKQAT
jgi:hypothetical protein